MPAKKFVLRMDEAIYTALEKWAADEFRSVNGQIEWILSQKLKETGRHPSSATPNKTPPTDSDAKEKS